MIQYLPGIHIGELSFSLRCILYRLYSLSVNCKLLPASLKEPSLLMPASLETCTLVSAGVFFSYAPHNSCGVKKILEANWLKN